MLWSDARFPCFRRLYKVASTSGKESDIEAAAAVLELVEKRIEW